MNDAKLYNVIRAPRVSEKTARVQEVSNQYVFEVATDATKADIKVAIEKLFDVQVKSVNVVNVKGKNKSVPNRAGRPGDMRKAKLRQAAGPTGDGMFTPPRMHGRPATSGWMSYPRPTRKAGWAWLMAR